MGINHVSVIIRISVDDNRLSDDGKRRGLIPLAFQTVMLMVLRGGGVFIVKCWLRSWCLHPWSLGCW